MASAPTLESGLVDKVEIRVRGRVQGVGFRPTVWRYARDLNLDGEVLNDGEGVLIRAAGDANAVADFIARLRAEPPPLAVISDIAVSPYSGECGQGFSIVGSQCGDARTDIAPDAVICEECTREVLDPFSRRFRYPFTNCTHCGPRLTIVRAVPYDRASTTMAPFQLCPDCSAEYTNPEDRRFHAEPIACHACGPRARLIRFDGRAVTADQHSMLDDVDAAMSVIQKGEIVAIKALGGFQLACDATKPDVVARLRFLKHREAKPFALMARDLETIRNYCSVSDTEERLLTAPESPIVLLDADGPVKLPDGVAPGMRTLGFMLPSTPMHVLMFRRMARPVVMTSGNLSDEPQAITDDDAANRLGPIASYALIHNREIANRVDDSVVREIAGHGRVLRRARGFAPSALPLPPGFEQAPETLAFGPQMKATFCLITQGRAVMSQHQGDLDDAATWDDYLKNLELYTEMYGHKPTVLACDRHPEYFSTKHAIADGRAKNLPLAQVQHHHAHIASCLAENGRPLDAPPVLGIALDGLGYGTDGTIWGGEFLLCDYLGYERLGCLKPVAMPGGDAAAREPWRNLYAHLVAELGWTGFAMNFGELDLFEKLSAKPRATLDAMIAAKTNATLASSCGRLFDAVAAALDLCFERQSYEGEAAARLEAIVCQKTMREEDDRLAYTMPIPNLRATGMPYIEPLGLWHSLLGDLIMGTDKSVIAARFHKGLAKAIAAMAGKLAGLDEEEAVEFRFDTVALSGGCFQNRVLFEETVHRLEARNFKVLGHSVVPANDGGIALGQAAVAAACAIATQKINSREAQPCA
ncbi:MAG: carbamoyltransferase HypF [Sphingomonas sp.]|jgi:hydrogenase maturation protein HypF|uniref:carbamoyltransferase HypF n=1 Tax=Sphingomonas sp. TaxID=28214 RepID=UPI0035A8E3D2|nr:carbamoyltransferase HypF [Sphingomonas sp.]